MQPAFILSIREKLEQEQSELRLEIMRCLQQATDEHSKVILRQLSGRNQYSWPELLTQSYGESLHKLRDRLEMVEAALSQIQIGQFGSCADCEKAIEHTTLELNPTEQRCQACKIKRRY